LDPTQGNVVHENKKEIFTKGGSKISHKGVSKERLAELKRTLAQRAKEDAKERTAGE
jgi:hypothetical protein